MVLWKIRGYSSSDLLPGQLQRLGPFVEIEKVSSLSRPLIEFFSILWIFFRGKDRPIRTIRDFAIQKNWTEVIQTEFSRLLVEGAEEIDVFLTNEHILAFRKYIDELNSWAKSINLIRRVSDREIVLKDFLDSLTLLKHLSLGASIIDLGSGAGFPGIPVKIVRPDLRLVLLEATRKKVYFLKNLVRHLGLDKTEVLWPGAKGGIGTNFLGPFDFVLSRAFGSLRKFSITGIRFLKQGGILLAMKGKKGEAELKKDLPSLEEMGLELAFFNKLRLPFLGHERILIGLRKKGCFT